jgi:uncharacterized repeat protein (TIGR03833 family)
MSSKGMILNDLKIGMNVEINPQSDRTRKLRSKGTISEILTSSDKHPHGILVLLKSGEKGRVKAIIEETPTQVDESSSVFKTDASIEALIEQGENSLVEFKAAALWSFGFTNDDIKNYTPPSKELHAYGKSTSKIIISKTIAGFLNTDGGTLIIGVKENKNNYGDEVVGVELEFKQLKDPCQDGYRRMLIDLVKEYFPSTIFNHLSQYMQIEFVEINEKIVCSIIASKSDKKVFLRLKNVDHFFIRIDASTRELQGVEIVDYCEKHFQR